MNTINAMQTSIYIYIYIYIYKTSRGMRSSYVIFFSSTLLKKKKYFMVFHVFLKM